MGIKKYKIDEFKELQVRVLRLRRQVMYLHLILLVFLGVVTIQGLLHGY